MAIPAQPLSSHPPMARRGVFESLFGLDTRSLALFRLGLATLLLCDLMRRAEDLRAHYSDFGVLPRGPLIDYFLGEWLWSVHLLSGRVEIVATLFFMAGLAACALFLGYRTKAASVISFLLLISLQNRNPVVLQGGDILLRLFAFWAMFLPLGVRFSCDAALDPRPRQPDPIPRHLTSVGTFAFVVQIASVYWFTALLKRHPIWTSDAQAVYYALSLDSYVTSVGKQLLNYPEILPYLTRTTFFLEAIGPFFLFIPFKIAFFRSAIIFVFIGLHASFAMTLSVGHFSYICILGWATLLPGAFWDVLTRFIGKPRPLPTVYFDGNCDFCRKGVHLLRTFLALPQLALREAQSDPSLERDMHFYHSWVVVDALGRRKFKFDAALEVVRASPIFRHFAPVLSIKPIHTLGTSLYEWVALNRNKVGVLTSPLRFRELRWKPSVFSQCAASLAFLYGLGWNLTTIPNSGFELPRHVIPGGLLLRLDQKWSMFAPYPTIDDGWYVMPGRLRNGTTIDVFRGVLHNNPRLSWQRPHPVADTYVNQRWRKYLTNLWTAEFREHWLYFGKYLCRKWNEGQPSEDTLLESFDVYFMLEKSLPDFAPPSVEKVPLWSHFCFKVPNEEP